MKEDVCNIPVWVKFYDIPISAFTKDGLSAILTKLDTTLMLDSYTSAMCTDSRERSSYARAMVELRDDVKLKDTFVVALPKVVGEGYIMSTIHVEKLVLANNDGKPLKPIMERGLLEDEDFDCYDGYEDRVYDLSKAYQAFCDQFDICLRSIDNALEILEVSCIIGFHFPSCKFNDTKSHFTSHYQNSKITFNISKHFLCYECYDDLLLLLGPLLFTLSPALSLVDQDILNVKRINLCWTWHVLKVYQDPLVSTKKATSLESHLQLATHMQADLIYPENIKCSVKGDSLSV
ncbi:hypothetical protein Tco_0121117 [Tanacetum coccineum]